jgi:hypothetical protein
VATATSRPRALLIAGLLLATLSLGLPWGFFAPTPGYLTLGYYTPGYCDAYYCYSGTYQTGFFIPGYSGGDIEGSWSNARFFIVGAFALALIGWRLGRARLMRAAALVAAAGIALHLTRGLTGGIIALGLAACCFWWASRDVPVREAG